MSSPTLDELTKPSTEDEVFEKFLSSGEELGLPSRSWRKGGAFRVILRIVARLYAAFSAVIAAFISSGYLEKASGEWLARLAYYVYFVDKRRATFAREKLTLTNSGGSVFEDIQPGAMVAIAPGTKKAYRNTGVFTIGALETVEAEFEAVEIGSASAAAPGTITQLEAVYDGVTATNPKSFIAIDDESDESLRQGCRDKMAARSVRGPRGAYAWAIREAKRVDGSPVNINRYSISTSSSKGQVSIIVAAPSGAPAADDLTAIDESIELRARPDAVRVLRSSATEVVVARALTIYAQRTDGVTADDLRSLVASAFVAEQPRYPIGGLPKPPSTIGKVWSDWIAGVAKGAHSTIYEIDGQGSDVDLGEAEVPVFQITVPTVRLVDLPVPL